MPANPSTSEMGRRHVERAAGALGCVPSAGSGNRWQNPADGRSGHDDPYPLALEGKSTRGKSLTVTLDMIAKLREQSLGENPVLPLCWYGTDDLTEVLEDWAAVPLDFLSEVLTSARAFVELEAELGDVNPEKVRALVLRAGLVDDLRKSLAEAHQALTEAGEAIAARNLDVRDAESEVARLRDREAYPKELAQWVPKLPWTVIRVFPEDQRGKSPGDPVGTAVRYEPDRTQQISRVGQVRIQRSAVNRPHVFADGVRVRNADVFGSDGRLLARSCEDDESIEEG